MSGRWQVDGSGSGSCPMVGFGISGAGPSISASTALVQLVTPTFCMTLQLRIWTSRVLYSPPALQILCIQLYHTENRNNKWNSWSTVTLGRMPQFSASRFLSRNFYTIDIQRSQETLYILVLNLTNNRSRRRGRTMHRLSLRETARVVETGIESMYNV
jgi:hypothetical protein